MFTGQTSTSSQEDLNSDNALVPREVLVYMCINPTFHLAQPSLCAVHSASFYDRESGCKAESHEPN